MRVFKNLFGNGSKINASEVVTKNAAGEVTALDLLGVECGSNANGEWVRFNFGLQVCWTYVYAWPGAKPDSTHGNVYRSSVNLLWTYPKAFVEEPAVSGTCTGNAWIGDSRVASGESKTNFLFRVFRGLDATADPSIRLKAIGWWKTPGT